MVLRKRGWKLFSNAKSTNFARKYLERIGQKFHYILILHDLMLMRSQRATFGVVVFLAGDVSSANQGKRKGLEGARSGLFYTYAKLIEERKPEWLIIENVPGLLNSHNGQDFKVVIDTLVEFGYGVSWRVLDAKYFGTPQRRRRVYIVASLGDMRSARVLLNPEQLESLINRAKERANASRASATGLSKADIYSIQHASIGRKATAGPQAKGYRNDGETYTLDSRGSSDAVCAPDAAFRVRASTGISRELDSNRFRAVGNAVAVPIVEWLGKRIVLVDQQVLNEALS